MPARYPHRVATPPGVDIPHPDVMLIQAEREVKTATVQLAKYHFLEPADNPLLYSDNYRLEFSLTRRLANSRACYEDAWGRHRYEPIGNTFLIPPNRGFLGKSDGAGKAEALLCEIKPEVMEEWIGSEIDWTDSQLLACLDIKDVNIRRILVRLAEELKSPGLASDILVEPLCSQLGIELTRFCKAASPVEACSGLSDWRLCLIDEYLRENLKTPTLTQLADLCQLSVRHLSRGFKVSRGCSIGAYIANHRIEQAKNLLAGDESIKQVAFSLGFSSSAAFIHAFRKSSGMAPLVYRKTLLS